MCVGVSCGTNDQFSIYNWLWSISHATELFFFQPLVDSRRTRTVWVLFLIHLGALWILITVWWKRYHGLFFLITNKFCLKHISSCIFLLDWFCSCAFSTCVRGHIKTAVVFLFFAVFSLSLFSASWYVVVKQEFGLPLSRSQTTVQDIKVGINASW